MKIQKSALAVLRVAADAFVGGLTQDAWKISTHAKRRTLLSSNLRLAKKLRAGGGDPPLLGV